MQRLHDGEVSPFLTDDLAVGDPLEVRGPLGGWFVWRPDASRTRSCSSAAAPASCR